MATQVYVNGVTLTDAAEFNKADQAAYAALTGVAGTNTITATGPASLTAYAVGQAWRFLLANTITGAATLNITPSGGAALGARALRKEGTTALVSGDYIAGQEIFVIDDGTVLQIQNAPFTMNGRTFVAPVLGTPASGVATNLTGTAAGLTAGNVTTNANLTGPVTSVGNATAIADGALALGKLATGTAGNVVVYSAAGVATVAATGTAAQIFTSNGAGAAPTFQADPSGSVALMMDLIQIGN